ncbi:hypothetical protein [Nonomuraea typhae]|uniref:Uncharacterized protein n=1 Tax=Nonomuraea typhae TaxID=2603600 RepID=A0ABW7YS08_9ACTN
MTQQGWTVAWWQSGWGVWAGDEPDFATPPAYTTLNIPHVASEAATYWALGVIPPGTGTVQCRFRGDPNGEANFRTWIEEQRKQRRRGRRLWIF